MYDWIQPTIRGKVGEMTFVVPIKHGFVPGETRTYEERVRSILKTINDRANKGLPTMIQRIPAIHFARIFILRPEDYLQYSNLSCIKYKNPPGDDSSGKKEENRRTLPHSVPELYDPDYIDPENKKEQPVLPSWLIFTTNFDGDLKDYIRAFSVTIASDLDKVWQNCEGYPQNGSRDFEAFWLYIRRHLVETNLFYAAYTDLSNARIQQLRVFKDHFDAFVARTRDDDGKSIEGIGSMLDEFIEQHLAFTEDFPSYGGTYDDKQSSRFAELRK